jgi:hypothetical protein
MTKKYSGVCQACKRESQYIERDFKIPVRMGGDNEEHNRQDLCLECHRHKTHLERTLFGLYCDTETVREWFRLAFQDNLEDIKDFQDRLEMRMSHFREVTQVIKRKQEGK